jgi:hypothetical protein
MPRNPTEVATERVNRAKDKVRKISAQLDLARAEASRAMLLAAEAGVKRSTLADLWQTSIQQIDRMLAKAKRERR